MSSLDSRARRFSPWRAGAGLWLLLTLLLPGMAGLHADHAGLESLEDSHALIFEEACHPREATHLEAAGSGHHAHPCPACLHLLRSASEAPRSLPRLVPPVLVSAVPAVTATLRSAGPRVSAGPRAPPAAV